MQKRCREGKAMEIYVIRIKGHIDQSWSSWFADMRVTNEENGDTVLSGPLVDQSALHSLLTKVHALNLTLLSVSHVESGGRKDS
jgi:hypothetical protein